MLKLNVSFQGGELIEVVSGGRPVQLVVDANSGSDGLSVVRIEGYLSEDDENLTLKNVAMSIDWGDGARDELPPNREIQSFSLTHTYTAGGFRLSIRGKNFAVIPSSVEASAVVVVGASQVVLESAPKSGTLFGPILPRDAGAPNIDQWQIDRGEDLRILESSAKMLLLTERGERVCEPDYGTSIRRSIFSSDPSTVVSAVVEDINSALSVWEPRLFLQTVDVAVSGSTATVNAVFGSRFSQQPFQVSLDFKR